MSSLKVGKHAKGLILWHELLFDIIDRKNKGNGLLFTWLQVAVTVDLTILISFNRHQILVKLALTCTLHK